MLLCRNKRSDHLRSISLLEGVNSTVFTPVKQTRIVEEICRQVTDRIVSGELKVGDRLPSERDLAVAFQVGRSTIRESLRKLEQAGLIVIRTGSTGGAYVADSGSAPVTRALTLMLQLEQVSPEHLLEARRAIEAATVRLAAQRATIEDLERIKAAVDSPDNFSGKEGFISANMAFHEGVAEAAKSKVLSCILLAIRGLIVESIMLLPTVDQWMMESSHSFHSRIYLALADRDADLAQRIMVQHLESFERNLLAALNHRRTMETT